MKTILLPPTIPAKETLPMTQPNPEVSPKPGRRRFTAEYKRRIVREADACTQLGEVGSLLRREGLYSSHVTGWRQSLRQAEEVALRAKKRGPKIKKDLKEDELGRLRRENDRLKDELRKAEVIIDIQKSSRSSWEFNSQPRGRRKSSSGSGKVSG